MAPSCATPVPSITEASQQEAVALCLERLRRAGGHFQAKRLAFEIRDVGFTPTGTLGTLELLVRWIFERATLDPQRCSAPCAALCFSLTPILPTFKPPGAVTATAKARRIDFRQTLLNMCQREFEAACNAASLENNSAQGSGEGAPVPSLTGGLQFLAYLYLHHLLTDRIMLSCLVAVASGKAGSSGSGSAAAAAEGSIGSGSEPLRGPNGGQRVEGLVRALLIAGRQLEECLAEQYRPVLDRLYDQLAIHKTQATSDLAPEVQALLLQLFELRKGGWAVGGGDGGSGGSASTASAVTTELMRGNGVPASSRNCCSVATSPPSPTVAAATTTSKWGKSGCGVMTVHRSSGRLVVAAPGSAATSSPPSPSIPASKNSSPCLTRPSSLEGGLAEGAGRSPAAAVLGRHQQLQLNGGGGGSSSSLLSRSTQNLEGLWELTPDTYNDVRGQLLSQPVATSPATLEAMADELVECAVAASGGDASCPCWALPTASTPRGAAAAAAVGTPDLAAVKPLTDAAWWADLMQQQWDAQTAACDIYVRLCVDALQQMSASTPSANSVVPFAAAAASAGTGAGDAVTTAAAGFNVGAEAEAAAKPAAIAAAAAPANGNGVVVGPVANAAMGDTGRAFRRALLSAAQAHFERCLAALLPAPPLIPAPGALPTSGRAWTAMTMTVTAATQPLEQSSSNSTQAAVSASSAAVRHAWGDMPAAAPDAETALLRVRGICHLLLGLLRHGILTPRIVLHCAAALVDGAAAGSALCLQCACVMLAGASKQSYTFKMAEAAAFESMVKRLQGLAEETSPASATAHSRAASAGSCADSGAAGSGDSSGKSSGGSGGTATDKSISEPADAAFRDETSREFCKRFVSWLLGGLRARQ